MCIHYTGFCSVFTVFRDQGLRAPRLSAQKRITSARTSVLWAQHVPRRCLGRYKKITRGNRHSRWLSPLRFPCAVTSKTLLPLCSNLRFNLLIQLITADQKRSLYPCLFSDRTRSVEFTMDGLQSWDGWAGSRGHNCLLVAIFDSRQRCPKFCS